MDDIDDDAKLSGNRYGINHDGQSYDDGYRNHQKLHGKDPAVSGPGASEYSQEENDIVDEEDEEQLEEEEDDENDQSNGPKLPGKDTDDNAHEEDVTDGDGDENDDNNEEDDDDIQKNHAVKTEDDLECSPKKQKLKSLSSAYELAPRVPAPSASAATALASKPSSGGRNPLTDWTEHETFVLLDAWGDRFLQRGRKSLRSEEWHEVADKVSKVSKIERTDTQCRNRLDTLKKKYKKEKIKFPDVCGGSSKWLYFQRMDMLMSSPPQQTVPSYGLESGKYSFLKPRVNLNHANRFDEMRNSTETTESTSEEGSIAPQAQKRRKGRNNDEACSFRLLADSIHKFSKIYEKIENSRRQQMVELEKMRMEFHKELETQKRQILERVQSEISKLEEGDDEDGDSAENGM